MFTACIYIYITTKIVVDIWDIYACEYDKEAVMW